MKTFKKVICLMLCLIMATLILASCKEDLGEVTYGRYVEQDITPENMKGTPSLSYVDDSGIIDMLTNEYDMETEESSFYRFRSTNFGETWEEVDVKWLHDYFDTKYDEEANEHNYLEYIAIAPNGDMVFSIMTYFNDDYTKNYSISKKADLSGNVEDYTFEFLSNYVEPEQSYNLYDFKYINNDLVFVNLDLPATQEEMEQGYYGNSKRMIYNITENREIFSFSDNDSWEWYTNSKYLFVMDYMTNSYRAINLSDGTEATDVKTPSAEELMKINYGYGNYSIAVSEDNQFYAISSNGMQKFSNNPEEETEEIMEGINFSYGSPIAYTDSFMLDAEDNFIITLNISNESGKVLKYSYDPEAPIYANRILKIYSLYDNANVRLAVSEYRKLHPEISISYDFPLTSDDMYYGAYDENDTGNAMTEEDAIKALNTEILNGKGPDIIILDNLSIESYMDKGILKDISSVLDDKEIFENAVEPFKDSKGKVFALPTRFSVPVIFGEKGTLEKYSSFDILVNAIVEGPTPPQLEAPDWEGLSDAEWEDAWYNYYSEMNKPLSADKQPVITFDDFNDLFNMFYQLNAPAIFTQKSGIDKEQLEQFLQYVKSVSDKYGYLNDEYDNFYGGGSVMISSSGGMGYQHYSQSFEDYASQKAQLAYSTLGSFGPIERINSSIYYNIYYDYSGMRYAASSQFDTGEDDVADDENEPDETDDIDGTDNSDDGIDDVDNNRDEPETADDGNEDADGEEESSESDSETQWRDPSMDYVYAPMNPDAYIAPSMADGVYYPSNIVGISSNTKLGDYATDFVKTMVSYEVQSQDTYDGLPILKEGFEKIKETYRKNGSYMLINKEAEGFQLMDVDFDTLLSNTTVPYFENTYLKEAISVTIYKYCKEEISLEEALDEIVKETDLYFAEKQ